MLPYHLLVFPFPSCPRSPLSQDCCPCLDNLLPHPYQFLRASRLEVGEDLTQRPVTGGSVGRSCSPAKGPTFWAQRATKGYAIDFTARIIWRCPFKDYVLMPTRTAHTVQDIWKEWTLFLSNSSFFKRVYFHQLTLTLPQGRSAGGSFPFTKWRNGTPGASFNNITRNIKV